MYLDKEKLDRIQEEIYSSGKWAVEKQGDLHISLKEDKSVVTEVDITISHRILALIKSLFPDAAIISEEEITEEKDNPPYTFVLDPIDGTDVYSQGFPSFCIALGILDSNKEPAWRQYLRLKKLLHHKKFELVYHVPGHLFQTDATDLVYEELLLTKILVDRIG